MERGFPPLFVQWGVSIPKVGVGVEGVYLSGWFTLYSTTWSEAWLSPLAMSPLAHIWSGLWVLCFLCTGLPLRSMRLRLLPTPLPNLEVSLPSELGKLFREALDVYSLRHRNRDSFVERFRANKELAVKSKDFAARKGDVLRLLNLKSYHDYELVLLSWSLGVLGVEYAEMVEYGVWSSLERGLIALDFDLLTEPQPHLLHIGGGDSSLSYKLLLFEGLARSKVYWRKLSSPLKEKLEQLVAEIFQSISRGHLDAAAIFLHLSQIDMRTKGFAGSTKKSCKDALLAVLKSEFESKTIDFSDFLYALSMLEFKLSKSDSKLKLLLKNSVKVNAASTPLRHHWKTVHALGAMGMRWSELDVNTR